MQLCKPASLAALIALASSPSLAVPVTESFSYDGTYLPSNAVPPAGQSTWQQFVGVGASIAPNSPTPGVATFVDSGIAGGERVAFFKTYASAAFNANPTAFEWEYNGRLAINSLSGGGVNLLGVRDEGGSAAGKTAMLGWNPANGQLGLYNNATALVQTINAGDFRDGRFHDYRVIKFVDPADSIMKVSVLIDGVPEGSPIAYSSLPTNGAAGQGFGYFTGSPTVSNVEFDEVQFGAPGKLPTFIASYNGTYTPDSATPPLTQTTWAVFNNIAAGNLAPNAIAGSARFNDNTGGRLSIFDTLTDTPVADAAYRFQTRLRVDARAQSSNPGGPLAYTTIGVRDEGTATGKSLLLGLFDSQLYFVDNSTNLNANSILIANVNLLDGMFHDILVEKTANGSGFLVQVYLDGVAQFVNPLDYSSLPNSVGTGNGFGYFSSSPGTSNILLDTLALSFITIPEPATVMLLLTGVPLMLRRRRAMSV